MRGAAARQSVIGPCRSDAIIREIRGKHAGAPFAWRAQMPHLTASLGLLLCVALGCGCRTDIDLSPDEGTEPEEQEQEEPECTADLTPRVEDCARPAAPDAVPIAQLFAYQLAADDEFLYYASEGRLFRLSMIGGEPEALTPPGAPVSPVRYVADGLLYWMHEGVVLRVPATGGAPEPVVEIIPNAVWALAGQDVIWGGPYSEPSAVYRTSSISGETTELLAEAPEESVKNITVDDDRALVTLDHSLVAIPLAGAAPQALVSGAIMVGTPPIVHDGQVYFGAGFLPPSHEMGIYRVDIDEPSTPELFVSGFPVAFVFDDDALYAHIIPETDVSGTRNGRIVRAPLSGGDAVEITDTSSQSLATGPGHGPYMVTSNALIVSGCNVYFTETCSIDPPSNEYRLVTMSKVP